VIPDIKRHGGSRIGDGAAAPLATGVTVAEALVAALVDHGIDTVFGVGGTHTLVLLGAIERAAGLDYVASRTEIGAAYMALGYARLSGKPAVLLTSTGPGALNVTAVLQDACWSSTPVIHLTTHVAETGFAGAVHETPQQNEILRLASKDFVEIDCNFVQERVSDAVRRATAAPAGPVTVTAPVGLWGDTPRHEGTSPVNVPLDGPPLPDLASVAEAIDGSARPLVYVGGGALKHDRGRAALRLAAALQAPIVTSYSGKTIAGWEHPQYLGPWSSESLVDELCAESDLALVLGSKLSAASTNYWNLSLPERIFRVGFAEEQHRAFPRIEEVRGDAAVVSDQLLGVVRHRSVGWATDRIPAIRDAVVTAARERAPFDMACIDAIGGSAAPVVVACETAKAGFWAMKFLRVRGEAVHVMSGYLAMGSALSMAVGMAVAGRAPVTAVLGDGGLQMSLAELATLAELDLPVTLVVIVDHAYGLLRDNSAMVGGSSALGIDLWNPDLAALCDAYGLAWVSIDTPEELAELFAVSSSAPRVALVNAAFSRQW
jgi:acetolactate synthase-1/2/3 large subunit